jgi:hypothetical protein
MSDAATLLSAIATILYLATLALVLRMLRDAGDRLSPARDAAKNRS